MARLYSSYYGKVYAAAQIGDEAEYRKFVTSFYKGSWIADGWNETTETIVGNSGGSTRTLMNTLGQRICGEWANPNDIRTITTNDLKSWGGELGNSPSTDSILALTRIVEGKLPRPLVPVMAYGKLNL